MLWFWVEIRNSQKNTKFDLPNIDFDLSIQRVNMYFLGLKNNELLQINIKYIKNTFLQFNGCEVFKFYANKENRNVWWKTIKTTNLIWWQIEKVWEYEAVSPSLPPRLARPWFRADASLLDTFDGRRCISWLPWVSQVVLCNQRVGGQRINCANNFALFYSL